MDNLSTFHRRPKFPLLRLHWISHQRGQSPCWEVSLSSNPCSSPACPPGRRARLCSAITLLVLLIVAGRRVTLWAQGETTGAITGQVTDPANAAVPGAAVTIRSAENGLRRGVKTDGAGRFNFPQLKPGTYSVKVEAAGFEPQENDSVFASLGQ